MVYLGYFTEQFKKLGLRLLLNYAFAKETTELLPGVEYNTTTNSSWYNYATLQILKPVYDQFLERIQQYVNDIKIAGEQSDLQTL